MWHSIQWVLFSRKKQRKKIHTDSFVVKFSIFMMCFIFVSFYNGWFSRLFCASLKRHNAIQSTQYNNCVCTFFCLRKKSDSLLFFFFERIQSTSTDSAFVAHSFVYDWHTTYRLIRFEMIGMFIFFLIELQFVYIRAAFDSNAMMCMMCMTSRLVAVQFFLFSLTFILF